MFLCCAGPAPLEPEGRDTSGALRAPPAVGSRRISAVAPEHAASRSRPSLHAGSSFAAVTPQTAAWRQYAGNAKETALAVAVLATLEESLHGNPEVAAAIEGLRHELMHEVVAHRRESLNTRRDSLPSDGSAAGDGALDGADSSTGATGTKSLGRRKRSRGGELLRRASQRKPSAGARLWSVVSSLAKPRPVDTGGGAGVGGLTGTVGSDAYAAVPMDDATRAWVHSELVGRRAHYDRQEPRINEIAEAAAVEEGDGDGGEPVSTMEDDPNLAAMLALAPHRVAAALEKGRAPGAPESDGKEAPPEGRAADGSVGGSDASREFSNGSGSAGRPPLGPSAASLRESSLAAAAAAASSPVAPDDRPIGQLPTEAYLPVAVRAESSLRSMVHHASLNRVASFQSARYDSAAASAGATSPGAGGVAPIAAVAIFPPLGNMPRTGSRLVLPPPAYPSSATAAGGGAAAGGVAVAAEGGGGGSYSLPQARQPLDRRTSFTRAATLPQRPVADEPGSKAPAPAPAAATGVRSSLRFSASIRGLFGGVSSTSVAVSAAASADNGGGVGHSTPRLTGATGPSAPATFSPPKLARDAPAPLTVGLPSDTLSRTRPPPTPKTGRGGAAASIYYVNPNAIGAAEDEGVVDDEDSYVRARLSVVQRIRDFAATMFAGTTDPARRSGASRSTLQPAQAQAMAGRGSVRVTRIGVGNEALRKPSGRAPGAPPLDLAANVRTASQVTAAAAAAAHEKDRVVVERLRLVTRWDFDVFEFGANTEGRPLAYISYELFVRFRLFDRLRVPENVFTAFLNRIENEYCFEPSKPNPYHTSLHAADVVQAVGHFLTVPRLGHIMDQLDAFSVLVSAIIHDFRHPGVSNSFLVKTGHLLALRYNDESVLENFHAAEAFAVLAQERYNIMQSLTPSQRSTARFTIIKTVLATDLAQVRGDREVKMSARALPSHSHSRSLPVLFQGGKFVTAFKAKSHLLTMGDNDEDKLLVMQVRVLTHQQQRPSRPFASLTPSRPCSL